MGLAWHDQAIERSRAFRSRILRPVVLPLRRIGISAAHLTALSFLTGLAAVWFVFGQHIWFVIFGIAHLLLDALDGVLARETRQTRSGAYADMVTDNLVTVLLLGKGFVVFSIPSFGVIAFAYLVHQLIYLLSRMHAPVLFGRTVLFMVFFLQWYFTGMLFIAALTAFGLGLQARFFLRKN